MRSLRDPRLLLLAAAAGLLVACLIGRRSDDLACKTTADCEPGRGCVEGYCVAPTCPAGCTCTTLLPDGSGYADCTIDCTGTACSGTIVSCPAGMACKVTCDNTNDCGRVDCSRATSCEVTCSGVNSCDQVTCGSGPCDVTCSGNNSCDGGVACSSSCSCDVTCSGTGACSTPATCPSASSCDTGAGCTPLPAGTCNTCS